MGDYKLDSNNQGGLTMDIREGLIPTVLGTAVTATGYALKQSYRF
jgi:hypothetical protein